MIALVDCNNFYVSCERVFRPKLVNQPVVVLSNNDGCVISRSEEAKSIGIAMGVPAFKIKDTLTQNRVTVLSSNYALYADMSDRVMKTLTAELGLEIEVYSIDEAFLNLAGFALLELVNIGTKIRTTLLKWTGIPVSVGIAETKTLAKVAGKLAKQSTGVKVLTDPVEIGNVLSTYPVSDVWGIGRQVNRFLNSVNVRTALDLVQSDDHWVKKHLTVQGLRTVYELRGIPCTKVETIPTVKKSICVTRSFGKDISDFDIIREALASYTAICARKLRAQHSCANIVTVILETNRFKENVPQYFNYKVVQLPVPVNDTPTLIRYAVAGLESIFRAGNGDACAYAYKKTGLIVSGLVPADTVTQDLFPVDNLAGKKSTVMKVIDRINDSMGKDVVRTLAQGYARKWKIRQEKLTSQYTSRWTDLLTVNVDKK